MRDVNFRRWLSTAIALISLSACSNGVFNSTLRTVLTPRFAIGQPDLTTTTASTGPLGLSGPSGVFVLGNRLFVSDTFNHRALVWDSLPNDSSTAPDHVLGQVNFTSGQANEGGSVSPNSLNSPRGLFATNDGPGYLFVADYDNNRVVRYDFPLSTHQAGSVFLGQVNGTSSASGNGASGMQGPRDVVAGGGRLYVSEVLNQRIVIFNSITAATGASADNVLGNSVFTGPSVGTSAIRFLNIAGIFISGDTLLAADSTNSRVLKWNTLPFGANEIPADLAIGQPNLTTGTNNVGNVASNNLDTPYAVAANSREFFICDNLGHRVLIYDGVPTDQGNAYRVVGQTDFSGSGSSAEGLKNPRGLFATDDRLYVADTLNNRVLVYDLP